ncbi:peptidase S8/S53 domain-containing protein [Collybia nuda]|uniref:Peptidase S8/S53 domain-containing protein n=1 Tax=Collybia nuda TaxID=64659 RepID=A0A9P5YG06_9AGAR|nr:peptidase S8/S53 domain-containing protein [Collybia nuda]
MMLFFSTLAVVFLAQKSVLGGVPARRSYDTHNYYVIEHDPQRISGASLADVARTLGVEMVEQVGELQNHWLVRVQKPSMELVARGEIFDPVVDVFESLRNKAVSRLSSRSYDEDTIQARRVVQSVRHLSRQVLRQRVRRAPPPLWPPTSIKGVTQKFDIRDPMFSQQWHLVNEDYPEHMMNVTPVWEMGFTGKGVISSVVDDGLDYTSDDLASNFDAENSYDFNEHVHLPYPSGARDRHGTRCAGQIAASKNNACGVGIAYESRVAAVRILAKPITDVDEAVALNYGYQNVSVYSCSWGPPDNGKAMGAPSYLIKKSVLNGINNGRGGKGSIFVFASGNGGGHDDQCNFDGYTNSIYSVTVSSVDYRGQHPYYSEACAANMIVAYSSGGGRHIVTTDKGKNKCTTTHGGTSAAAPNAAGVFVLAVQARPDLTWRDIQYLCIETAKIINPDDSDWERTATGRLYSYKYGFGVLDAHRFVTTAQKWQLVKPQAWFVTDAVQLDNGRMNEAKKYTGGSPIGPGGVTSKITITKEILEGNNFEALEHINIQVWIDHTRRGDVEVEIISPGGVRSILGKSRPGDEAKSGYPGWVFMSVKHWGEDPVGDWTIKVSDQQTSIDSGRFLGWRMKFWGTTIDESKATKYELPLVDNILPPLNDPTRPIVVSPTVTNTHARPTPNLDDETITSPESEKEDTWFKDVAETVTSHKLFFGVVGAVVLIGTVGGIFLWRKRAARLRLNYVTIPASDTLPMGTLPGTEGSHLSGNEEGRHPQDRVSTGLGFHSGFLDDDDMSMAGPTSTPQYRDEPEADTQPQGPLPVVHVSSPSPRLSVDGGWENARVP